MKTWDIFDTLIARRILDGHAIPHLAREAGLPELTFERKLCFPIAENVRQVRPGDLLVSDMHLPAEEIAALVHDVTGLSNGVIVTPDGKRTGRVWKELSRQHSIALHTGDDRIADDDMARHEGIPTNLYRGALMTERELDLQAAGYHRLAMACREGRLRTFDPEHRELERIQTQINFPMLYLAALALRPHFAGRRVLASARDCWLFQHLLRDVAGADVLYWQSSRLARAFPSESYLRHTAALIQGETILFDLCGSGWSLKRLAALLPVKPAALWMLAYCGQAMTEHYERLRKTEGEVKWLVASASQGLEHNNLAPHPMVSDWRDGGPRTSPGPFPAGRAGAGAGQESAIQDGIQSGAVRGGAQFWNPTGFDWAGSAEIRAQHGAFNAARRALNSYPQDVSEPVPTLELIQRLIAQLPELAFFPREDRAVQEELRRMGDADSARSLGPIPA